MNRAGTSGGSRTLANLEVQTARLDSLYGRRWVGALFLTAAVALPLLRKRRTLSWRTIWPQDARVYVHQAASQGSLESLFRGYNGYLQLPPRILAVPTPSISVQHLSYYLAFVSVMIGGLLAWSVYHLSRSWLGSRLLQVILASFVVLMPVAGFECTANITNTIWMFLAVLPWALISMEETGRDTFLRSVLAFLAATSSALSLLFFPLALGWVAYRRTRPALIVISSFVVGLTLQGAVTLGAPPGGSGMNSASILRDGISTRVFGVFAVGSRWEADWWSADWRSLVVVGPLITVALLVVLAAGAARRTQVMAAAFTGLSVVFFAVAAWGRGTPLLGIVEGGPASWAESRFSVVPVMLLASAFAILLGSPSGRRMAQRIGVPMFSAWTITLLVVCFTTT